MFTLKYGDVFTVAEYTYTKFQFGTDNGYRATYREAPRADAGQPWAFALPAVLTAWREAPTPVDYALKFGDIVKVNSDGISGEFRLARDHNRNVKFIPRFLERQP